MNVARTLAPRLLPLIAATLLYQDVVFSTRALPDDADYACAARAVDHGSSPYTCPRYLYPPLLAQLEAAASHALSPRDVAIGLRVLELLAAVWIIDLSLSLLPLAPWTQAWTAIAFLAWSRGVQDALRYGNLTPSVAALALWALSAWPTRPIRAGLALGLSIALKPLAPLALVLLCCHRPLEHVRPQRTAAAIATLSLAALSWPGRAQLPRLLQQDFRQPTAAHNVSAQRLASLLGVSLHPAWVLLAVGLIALLYVRRKPRAPSVLLHVSCASALLSQPVIWAHTMLLVYPLLAAAVAKVAREAPAAGPHSARVPMLLGVCWAALCVMQSQTFGDLSAFVPRPLAALLTIIPLALLFALARYTVAPGWRVAGDAQPE